MLKLGNPKTKDQVWEENAAGDRRSDGPTTRKARQTLEGEGGGRGPRSDHDRKWNAKPRAPTPTAKPNTRT